jgi:hypothetical protein
VRAPLEGLGDFVEHAHMKLRLCWLPPCLTTRSTTYSAHLHHTFGQRLKAPELPHPGAMPFRQGSVKSAGGMTHRHQWVLSSNNKSSISKTQRACAGVARQALISSP